MGKTNGKPEAEAAGEDVLNLDDYDFGNEPAENAGSSDAAAPQPGHPEAGVAPASAPAEVAAELEKLKRERDSLLDRCARLQAEFENARRRGQREAQEYREYALAEALKLLLPVLDSFELALKAHEGESDFLAGVELIYRQLSDVLSKLGVEAIPAAGEPFDPNVHEAVQVRTTTDIEDNHVLEELQRGYRIKDRLLRPAMVSVARHPDSNK